MPNSKLWTSEIPDLTSGGPDVSEGIGSANGVSITESPCEVST